MFNRLRRLLPVLMLAVLSVGGVRYIQTNLSQNIAFKPLQLDPAHAGVRRIDNLIVLNAWELMSLNEKFGGISGLTILNDGRFVGVSDAGTLIGFGLSNDDRIDRPFIAPLPGSTDPSFSYKDRDSESITYDPNSGQFWVSYENNHAIRRYSRSFSRLNATARPKEMQDWPANRGAEALLRLSDGRFLAISESLDDDTHKALLFSGDPVEPGTVTTRFTYRPPNRYRVTDGTQLPDGRIAILYRSIGVPEGFSAKLGLVEPSQIGNGKIAKSRVIATLSAPLLVDNMEGIAAEKRGDATIIWLISDDNFFFLQRTILMKFRLSNAENAKKPGAEAAPGFDSL